MFPSTNENRYSLPLLSFKCERYRIRGGGDFPTFSVSRTAKMQQARLTRKPVDFTLIHENTNARKEENWRGEDLQESVSDHLEAIQEG